MNQATAERMITVGTKDQAMILVRRLFHQFFFILALDRCFEGGIGMKQLGLYDFSKGVISFY